MVINKKVTGTASSLPAGVTLGLLISILITLLGAALIAYLMVTQKLREDTIGYTSMVVLALASAAGSLIAAGKIKRMRFQVCMITGVGYYLFLLASNALFFGGQYEGMGVTALIVLLGSGCAAVIESFFKNGMKLKFKKPVYR